MTVFRRRRPDSWRRWTVLRTLFQVAIAAVAGADDWLHHRGNAHDGRSLEVGLRDPSGGLPTAWTRPLGQGYSGFVVRGDLAVTQYQDTLGQYLLGLDLRTGSTRWKTRYDAPYDPAGMYPGPRSTPCFSEDLVCFATPDGDLAAAELMTGVIRWRRALKRDLGGRGTDFGYSASPVIADGLLLVPVGGRGAAVVALDLKDGAIRWKLGDDEASYAGVLPFEADGRRLAAAFLQNSILLLDRQRGVVLNRIQLSGGYDEHSIQPLHHRDRLLFPAPFKSGTDAYFVSAAAAPANDPRPGQPDAAVDGASRNDAETGPAAPSNGSLRRAWHSREFSADVCSPVVVDGLAFGFDLKDLQAKLHRPSRGTYRCLDVETGKTLWSSDGPAHGSSVIADGRVWHLNDRGELVVFDASPDGYRERLRQPIFPAGTVVWTQPALASGRLLLRTHERVICLDLRPEGSAETVPSPSSSSPWLTLPSPERWLGGEREMPFARPTFPELRDWFLDGAIAWGAAIGLMTIARFAPGLRGRVHGGQLWMAVVVSGLVGSAALNQLPRGQSDRAGDSSFHFTLPLSLAGLLWFALEASRAIAHAPTDRGVRRRSRVAGLLLASGCLAYFLLLRRLSMPHEWVFACGLLPSALVIGPLMARRRVAPGFIRATAELLGLYVILFWSAAWLVTSR
jgi:outer membrane protein assembly factor BamB